MDDSFKCAAVVFSGMPRMWNLREPFLIIKPFKVVYTSFTMTQISALADQWIDVLIYVAACVASFADWDLVVAKCDFRCLCKTGLEWNVKNKYTVCVVVFNCIVWGFSLCLKEQFVWTKVIKGLWFMLLGDCYFPPTLFGFALRFDHCIKQIQLF